jgi:hypothetical protein
MTTPAKWSGTPPTANGWFWWRHGPNFKPRLFDVQRGIVEWPSGARDIVATMQGEWLQLQEPDESNENI